jgi:hypothetical protein
MRRHLILAAIAALTVAGKALADGISYSYLQADLLVARACDDNDDDDCFGKDVNFGFGVHGSAGIGRYLFGFLDFTSPNYRDAGVSLRLMSTSLGLGIHLPLAERVDFIAGASFERLKEKVSDDGDSFGVSWDGWGLMAGARGLLPLEMEWNTSLKYRDIEVVDSIISATLGVRRHFTPSFVLGLDITENRYDELTETMFAVNFRYDFGARR